jgi:drug/metabolite transporter (DMT)-like permease
MLGVNEVLLMISEIVLSAYPLLIKLVDATVLFQVGLRMYIYAGLGAAMSVLTGNPLLPATLFSRETIATGALNLLHVIGSYVGFDQLAAGNAMALFYTYPVWNILGASFFFGEKVPLRSLPWIGLALAGTIALAQPSRSNWTMIGVVAALIAAITETGIYLWFKSHKDGESTQPYTKMTQMYGSSGVMWTVGVLAALGLGFVSSKTFKISGSGLRSILLFNSLVGFVGYALRFYLIPKVSTVIFSALSFFGVISAYLLSWLFTSETPSLIQALGAAAIVLANVVLVSKETV